MRGELVRRGERREHARARRDRRAEAQLLHLVWSPRPDPIDRLQVVLLADDGLRGRQVRPLTLRRKCEGPAATLLVLALHQTR